MLILLLAIAILLVVAAGCAAIVVTRLRGAAPGPRRTGTRLTA